jgi:hypothetical protein
VSDVSVGTAYGDVQPAGAWLPGEEPEIAARTPWQLFRRRFREDRVALVALAFIVVEILCRYATEICRTVDPPLVDYGNGHVAACHHPLNAYAPARV